MYTEKVKVNINYIQSYQLPLKARIIKNNLKIISETDQRD